MSTEEARMETPTMSPTDPITALEPVTNQGSDASAKSEVNLGDELRVFGKHIESLFSTARNTPRARELEQQLTSAWRDMERGVNSTISRAQSADVKGTMTGTAQYAADEVQGGLARGLHTLNQWMSQKISETEENRKKKEQLMAAQSPNPKQDDEIEDRFSGNDPVFGEDLNVPNPPVEIKPEPAAEENSESLITERFEDEETTPPAKKTRASRKPS